ncbi:MAG: peptidoglycan DD-metalloendopeptidase family protein [Limimaricola sp.]|uniref:murein hydrolase activator EnvC family protein n=1 Tax=Limimaricola sp. TaxID=2211665 RepID=UPI001E081CD6|nr:peptidoglycan DD-metalloendopeptidase family protein [Limimaricola sp.]MBI1418813.1 peptidoglycan DD-metalloendopeptidase family protein [Limimaricola sp.]
MIRPLAALLALTLPFSAAMAADAPQSAAATAEAARAALVAAQDQLTKAEGARDRVAALTATVKAYEQGLIALRDGLRRATIRQQAIEAQLAAQSDEVAQLLAVLETMGKTPEPVMLLHPSGALGTARSGMLLADVTPALQDKVATLRARLQEVADLRKVQDGAADTLRRGLADAQKARAELSAAISDRTDLPRRFAEDEVQTALLLASTDTLAAFASGLDGTLDGPETGTAPDATPAKGALPLPVAGQVLRGFNAADAAGIVRPGWVIATAPRALVTTPVAATVRFRGPLLDYGNVVILEPAPGVLFVLAGLGEVYGEAGQVLPAGSPVGLMGGATPDVDAILTETAAGAGQARTETLYLEVREGQGPVDPATWFAPD